jgi:hypothetical protein
LLAAGEKRLNAISKYEKLEAEFKIIDADFNNKNKTLPEGDPALDAAFVKLKDIAGRLSLAIDELEGADTQYNAAASDALQDTPGGRLFGI